MQKRLIEELAALRGGKTRLRALRGEYEERQADLVNELDELEDLIAAIDTFTEVEEEGELKVSKKVTKEVTSRLPEADPVDSIGE